MPKLTISLKIETVVDRDGGYYGINNYSLHETVRLIKRDMDNYQIFIQQGGAEMKEVRAKVSLIGLTVTDVDDVKPAEGSK